MPMSGQEAFDVVARMFFDAGVPVEDVPGPDALVRVGGIILAERAHSAKLAERVAELERERDEARQLAGTMSGLRDQGELAYDKQAIALAAAQAENVRLREALTEAVRVSGPRYLGDTQPEWVERAVAALATPSPTAALREVCEKVAGLVWALAAPDKEMDSRACIEAVSSIIGEVKP